MLHKRSVRLEPGATRPPLTMEKLHIPYCSFAGPAQRCISIFNALHSFTVWRFDKWGGLCSFHLKMSVKQHLDLFKCCIDLLSKYKVQAAERLSLLKDKNTFCSWPPGRVQPMSHPSSQESIVTPVSWCVCVCV